MFGLTVDEMPRVTAPLNDDAPATVHVINDGDGNTVDGAPQYVVGEYWNKGFSSYGQEVPVGNGSYGKIKGLAFLWGKSLSAQAPRETF
jgi:hypothetical protein